MLSRLSFVRVDMARTALVQRAFTTARPVREHFLNATPAVFEQHVLQGGDRVVLVDFYAE